MGKIDRDGADMGFPRWISTTLWTGHDVQRGVLFLARISSLWLSTRTHVLVDSTLYGLNVVYL